MGDVTPEARRARLPDRQEEAAPLTGVLAAPGDSIHVLSRRGGPVSLRTRSLATDLGPVLKLAVAPILPSLVLRPVCP
jgi:hypothetical protein